VPAVIADVGDYAGWRYVEFFTANSIFEDQKINAVPNAGNPQKVQRYPRDWADGLRDSGLRSHQPLPWPWWAGGSGSDESEASGAGDSRIPRLDRAPDAGCDE
jgi:hypothetical protein